MFVEHLPILGVDGHKSVLKMFSFQVEVEVDIVPWIYSTCSSVAVVCEVPVDTSVSEEVVTWSTHSKSRWRNCITELLDNLLLTRMLSAASATEKVSCPYILYFIH